MKILSYILSFKAYVLLPVIIFIIAVLVSIKPSKALKSALTMGVGLAGIFIVIDFMVQNVGPAIQNFITHTHLNYPVMDIGWPSMAAASWASEIGAVAIPVVLLINVFMITFNLTKTIDVDIWNYWHFIFMGVLVYTTTHSFMLGIFSTMVIAVITLKLADWTAPIVKERFGFSGISFPTVSAVTFFPIGIIGNFIIDKIPVINKLHANPESIKKNFGIFGEPIVIGFIIGGVLGLVAGYDVKGILDIGMSISIVMVLLPAMSKILVGGLKPISEGINDFMKKKFPDKGSLYLSVDPALLLGDTSVLVSGLMLIPISMILAFIIPGNRIIPLTDLTNLMTTISMVVLACNRNVIRSLIIGVPVVITDLLISSKIAYLTTEILKIYHIAQNTSYKGLMSSFTDAGNPLRFWLFKAFSGNILAIASLPVLFSLLYVSYCAYKRFLKMNCKEGISK